MTTSTPHGPALARLLGAAADAVQGVTLEGRSLTELLAETPPELRAGTQAVAFHTLRHWGAAQAVAAELAPKLPPPRVAGLLHVALALLWPGDEPMYAPHTVVDQAVSAARTRTPAAAGFLNAVLRRFLREREALLAAVRHQPMVAWNHPAWWVQRVQHDWPTHWQALLTQANTHPPMTLRVNARRGSGEAYVARLASLGIAARLLADPALAGQAVVLAEPCPVTRLPGFAEGEVSVQDASAQRAASLLLGTGEGAAAGLALPPGARVLDACAAPGGKTAQLLERAELDLLALDSDALRLARVRETLARLRLPAAGESKVEVRAGDARRPAEWWDGRPFDAILLDAPCTASGIVRRHPDVRWLRRPSDIHALAATQSQVLEALWPLLKPGGRLLYATCSIFKAEGEQQADAFLQRHGGGGASRDPASPGHLLPLAENPALADASPAPRLPAVLHDGFFYALLHKTATTPAAPAGP